jgi:hypothetical protein
LETVIQEKDQAVVSPEPDAGAFDAFVQELKQRYRPDKILLFGSRARGETTAASDYDLLVVSGAFEGVSLTDRATDIYRIWPLWADLDCLCLTPDEFERSKRRISIVREIERQGISL